MHRAYTALTRVPRRVHAAREWTCASRERSTLGKKVSSGIQVVRKNRITSRRLRVNSRIHSMVRRLHHYTMTLCHQLAYRTTPPMQHRLVHILYVLYG